MGLLSEQKPLRPSLWRTCRVIACESRLRLLWMLFDESELCVCELAHRVKMGEPQASVQLRALNARGLISFRRKKMQVFYFAKANDAVDFAPQLLEGLRMCHNRGMKFSTVIRHATAFTHQRRIELVRILRNQAMDSEQLLDASGMSASALFLHLKKLTARGVVKKMDGKYALGSSTNPLGRVMLQAALSGPFDSGEDGHR